MESTFDVFLTGGLLPGYERGDAVSELASVFKLELSIADQLADGSRRRVKAGCNKAAALQLRHVLTTAGLEVAVQRHGDQPSAPQAIQTNSDPEPVEKAVFEAQPATSQSAAPAEVFVTEADAPVDYEPVPTSLAQAGKQSGQVILEGELEIAPVGELLVEPKTEVEPPVSELHFDLAPAGAPIPNLKRDIEELDPNIDHLHLATEDGD